MKNTFGVLMFSFTLLCSLPVGYCVWFRPKRYMKYLHERKVRFKSRFYFLPDWLIDYIFYYEKPRLAVWWARSVILFVILVSTLGIVGSIHGPF